MLQILQNLKHSMSENRHEPESVPDRIFTSMFNDITDYALKMCKEGVWTHESRSLLCGKTLTWSLLLWFRIGPDLDRSRPTSHFANGKCDKLASVMGSRFITSKHLVFKCSHKLQTWVLTSKKGNLESTKTISCA